jgi:hypothetical protein
MGREWEMCLEMEWSEEDIDNIVGDVFRDGVVRGRHI